jgi:hypothetical protein
MGASKNEHIFLLNLSAHGQAQIKTKDPPGRFRPDLTGDGGVLQ